jgi:hypothetical protein
LSSKKGMNLRICGFGMPGQVFKAYMSLRMKTMIRRILFQDY